MLSLFPQDRVYQVCMSIGWPRHDHFDVATHRSDVELTYRLAIQVTLYGLLSHGESRVRLEVNLLLNRYSQPHMVYIFTAALRATRLHPDRVVWLHVLSRCGPYSCGSCAVCSIFGCSRHFRCSV